MAKKTTITENGITFRLNQEMTATVVQYTTFGAMAIVVPKSVQGYTVTGIDPGVFRKCDNIRMLTIPLQ